MSRIATLIGAAFAVALSAGAASALPLAPQQPPRVVPEAAPLVEPVHDRRYRKFRGHHPHVFFRRHHRPSFSFSLQFGSPVVRQYPRYYYPYRAYHPYYARPHYYRRSYAPGYYYRW